MKHVILFTMVTLFLTACSLPYTTNDKQQYASSRNGPVLVVPPPLTRENLSNFYELPAQNGNPKVSVAPPVDSTS